MVSAKGLAVPTTTAPVRSFADTTRALATHPSATWAQMTAAAPIGIGAAEISEALDAVHPVHLAVRGTGIATLTLTAWET